MDENASATEGYRKETFVQENVMGQAQRDPAPTNTYECLQSAQHNYLQLFSIALKRSMENCNINRSIIMKFSGTLA